MVANGNEFHAFVEAAVAEMGEMNAMELYRQPLPSAEDDRLRTVGRRFRSTDHAQRKVFNDALSSPHRSVMGIFAHRAATLAVRQEDTEWLEIAFLAAVIANQEIPESRNVDLLLAVLYHCARKLERTPSEMFDWAATYANEPLARHLEQFGRREDISLKKFGWTERRTPDGIRFTYQWR